LWAIRGGVHENCDDGGNQLLELVEFPFHELDLEVMHFWLVRMGDENDPVTIGR
jgi:hypothetical protein